MQDKVIPGDKWEFSQDVADCFPDMLKRSIPSYSDMRMACYKVGERMIKPGSAIVDLGASNGEAISMFVGMFKDRCRFVACETSKPMIEAFKNKYKEGIDNGYVEINDMDLRFSYPQDTSCLTLSVLTLQFIPIEYRQNILKNVYDHLIPGGALIFVEKILGTNAKADSLFTDIYYDIKANNGYNKEAIDRKRFSLEGVLVPVTFQWNEDLLKGAGFDTVDCFWRWMNFAGWVAIKS